MTGVTVMCCFFSRNTVLLGSEFFEDRDEISLIFSFPHFFPSLSSARVPTLGHCVLKILTSLGLIWCQTQSKPAIKLGDGMKQPINQKFSSNRLSPFSHLKLCGGSGGSAGFLTFAFSHIVIHFLVLASDRQE